MKKRLPILILTLLSLSIAGSAQSIVGKWKTIDDNTGEERSIIEIFEKNGKFFGRVSEIILKPGDDPDPTCDECTDDRKGKKVIGMTIIEDMELDGDTYSGGEILDPENGKVYRCKIWLDGDELKVRGYLYFFFRTQTWYRAV